MIISSRIRVIATSALASAVLAGAGGPQLLTAPADAAPAAASALAPAAAGPGSMVTQDALPTVQVNGVVWNQVVVGTTVYAVGRFTKARPAGAAVGQNETTRNNILAFDIRTGALITSFDHSLNDEARAITASPDGSTVYVGGKFTQVDGQGRQRMAAFSTSTGALLPFNPKPASEVLAVAATNDTVYFGGNFVSVNNIFRTRLAAVTTSGTLLPFNGGVNNQVRGIVVSPDKKRVVVGGQFNQANGAANYGLAALDATTGANLPFPAGQKILASNNSTSAGIYSLRTDGTYLYGAGINAVSAQFPQFEGSFSADFDGNVRWVNDCFGDSYDAAPINGAVFVASHAHDCAAAGGFGEQKPNKYYGMAFGAQPSSRYNVRDSRGWDYSAYPTSGIVQWNPRFAPGSVAGQSVWAFAGNSEYVVAGGEFPRVNGTPQQGLVRFAVRPIAPDLYGPKSIGAPTGRQVGTTRAVQVTAQSAYDPDTATLSYQLIRNGDTANPVATTTLPTVAFWQEGNRPNLILVDRNAPAGQNSYTIRVSDGGRRAVSTLTSAATSVTVSGLNYAQGRPATQSSVGSGGTPNRAVDGNTNGNFAAGSVTHTNADPNSWWQVDLGRDVPLTSIDVFNRTDAAPERLSDYWVFVSSTPFDTTKTPAQQAATAGVWSQRMTTRAGSPTSIPTTATGRYLMVQQNTPNQILSLAEVRANGAPLPASLSTGQPASQSSTLNGLGAGNAVDGTLGTIQHTSNGEANPWWQVDLGSSRSIGTLRVTPRQDCCQSRLSNYWVFVSDTPFNTSLTPAQQAVAPGVWSSRQTVAPTNSGATINVGRAGRYVMVQQGIRDYLHLAEVEVFN